MTIADRYGLPISTASTAAADRYQEGWTGILAFGLGAGDSFAGALAADEGLALAHAGRALVAFFLGDGAGAGRISVTPARSCRGRPGASASTWRPSARSSGATARAARPGGRARGRVSARCPACEPGQHHHWLRGTGRPRGLSSGLHRAADPAYGQDWWFQSALAFTYHEVGRLDESRRLSERSLAQYPANANASHNIAHVAFETADAAGGVAFLEQWLADYPRRAPYHCHLSWHLALFEVDRGRYRRALEMAERDIVGSANPRATRDGRRLSPLALPALRVPRWAAGVAAARRGRGHGVAAGLRVR